MHQLPAEALVPSFCMHQPPTSIYPLCLACPAPQRLALMHWRQPRLEAPHPGDCWCFLAWSLGLLVLGTVTKKCMLVYLNVYRINPQAHGYTVVAFHPKVFKVS
jgi:hypothetical protein